MSARCSLLTEPWWARARVGSAPPDVPLAPPTCEGVASASRAGARPSAFSIRSAQRSLRWDVSRSAWPRELQNTIVERTARIRSMTSCSTNGQMLPPASSSTLRAADRLTSSGGSSPCPSVGGRERSVMSSTATTTSSSSSDGV